MMRMIKVAAVSLLILALYSIAGTDDRFDELTVQQQEQVVARWAQR